MSPRPILSRRAITGAVTDPASATPAAIAPTPTTTITPAEPSTGQKIVGTTLGAGAIAAVGATMLLPVAALVLLGAGAYYLVKHA